MDKIIIEGTRRLSGTVKAQGAKNSVLPILAATILSKEPSIIHNCPDLKDVASAVEILEHLGCSVKRESDVVIVDPLGLNCYEIPLQLMREMRSSVIFLGAILGRCGKAIMTFPGGCELGPRPIDIHIDALKKLGANIIDKMGIFDCTALKLKGTALHLSIPSVGATENIMLAASISEGTTIINNAAKEPEIEDLQKFLNKMGARIKGAGTANLVIEGVKSLHGAEHDVMPDRIVAATYLAASAITGGNVELVGVVPEHLNSIVSVLRESGCSINTAKNSIVINRTGRILPVRSINTAPYPGFPTDAQAIIMSYLTMSTGTSVFVENIFENRFKHVGELAVMGADIKVIGHTAIVYGVEKLRGAKLVCGDLRGGAALVVAALAGEGTSEITNIQHIDRGYEKLEENLTAIGADIQRM